MWFVRRLRFLARSFAFRRAVFLRFRFFGPNFAMNMAGDGFYGFVAT